jgi:hypothetical protein
MGVMCNPGMHKWEGCKCTACGNTRDEGHKWDDGRNGTCKCETCGQAASEEQESIIDNANKSAG